MALARWFYAKSSFWGYEREWRCLKAGPGAQSFPPDALKRIIAGCVNTEATLVLIRETLKGTPIQDFPVSRAVRKARRFGLDLVLAG